MAKLPKRSKRGIIALSTLLVSVVLLTLVAALLLSLQGDKFSVLQFNHSTEALYVAEAGVADASLQMARDNSWGPTVPLEVTLPEGGKYTIVFDDDGIIEPFESVNNLASRNPADGPRGPGTVPAGAADVVVKVEARGRTELYEVMISRGISEPINVPILASGEIELRGAVNVSGIESLTSPVPVEAGIHSNSNASRPGLIDWDGEGEDAFIDGEVTIASTHPDAIVATGGEFNTTGVSTGRGSKQFPLIDVDMALVLGRRSTPLVPSTGGTTVVTGSDHRFPGGVINGDLELDGVNLYVSGDLEVNGTIKGNGAIFVKGDTSFRGNSELGGSSQVLALFSEGNVKLEGFDGTQYLEAQDLSNPDFQKWNDDAKWAHQEMKDIITDPDNYTDTAGPPDTWGNSDGNRFDELRKVLGEDDPGVPIGREADTLGKMADYLESNFGGAETADFLVERLRSTREIYENKTASGLTPQQVIDNFIDDSDDNQGVLDVLNDEYHAGPQRPDRRASGQAQMQDFEKLGTSYFQGIVYTTGAVYASNEVEVVGALLAERNGNSPAGFWDVNGDGSVRLRAGDVHLGGGSSLIYNKEVLEDPFAGATFGPVSVSAWLGR